MSSSAIQSDSESGSVNDWKMSPMMQLAWKAYLRDLPEMLKTHYRQWVAYHGGERVGFNRKGGSELVHLCLQRGYRIGDVLTMYVSPWNGDDNGVEEIDG